MDQILDRDNQQTQSQILAEVISENHSMSDSDDVHHDSQVRLESNYRMGI